MRRHRYRRQFHRKHGGFHRPTYRPSPVKSSFYGFRRFVLRHPLLSSVGSVVLAIILVRLSFSNTLFGSNIGEFRLWFIFFAIVIGIVGIVSLVVWMRRNVPRFYSKHDVNWTNR